MRAARIVTVLSLLGLVHASAGLSIMPTVFDLAETTVTSPHDTYRGNGPRSVIDGNRNTSWQAAGRPDRIILIFDVTGVAHVRGDSIVIGSGDRLRIGRYEVYARNHSGQMWMHVTTVTDPVTGDGLTAGSASHTFDAIGSQFRVEITDYTPPGYCRRCGVPIAEYSLFGVVLERGMDRKPPNVTVIDEHAVVNGHPIVTARVTGGAEDVTLTYTPPTVGHELAAEEGFERVGIGMWQGDIRDVGALDRSVTVQPTVVNGTYRFRFPAATYRVQRLPYTITATGTAGNERTVNNSLHVTPRINVTDRYVAVTYGAGTNITLPDYTEQTLARFFLEEGLGQAVETGTTTAIRPVLSRAGVSSARSTAATIGRFAGLAFSVLQYTELANRGTVAELRFVTGHGLNDSVTVNPGRAVRVMYATRYGTNVGNITLTVAPRDGDAPVYDRTVLRYMEGPVGQVYYLRDPITVPGDADAYTATLHIGDDVLDRDTIHIRNRGGVIDAITSFLASLF